MKKKLIIISLALAMLFSVGYGYKDQAEAHTTVSFSLFFDALSPYGNWMSTPNYGYVWQPADVGSGWRPYTDGQWVWTDYGWTWVSYQPWGWAPYHYGRWIFTNDFGWVWIPGTVWSPAWVTWYTGPNYIGWAPLPPDNSFFLQIGIGPIGFSYSTQPDYAVFVPSNRFLYSNINSVVVPSYQNVTIIKNTTNINNITIVNNRVLNNGPDPRFVEKATGARVQKVNVVERNIDPSAVVKGGVHVNEVSGRNLYVFRPDVVKKGNEAPPVIKGFETNTLKTKNRNERIQNQGNYQGNLQNSPNQQYPIYKKGPEKNKNNERVLNQGNFESTPNQQYPIYKKGNEKNAVKNNERILNQGNLESLPNQQYPINKKGAEKNTVRIRNGNNEEVYQNSEIKKNKKTQNQNNSENPHNQQYPVKQPPQYPMQWDNKRGNSPVMGNATQFQNPDIHLENRYPVHKNTERQFSSKGSTGNIGNLRQIPEANNGFYSYPQMNQKSYYETKPDARGQKFQQRGFNQYSSDNNRSLDLRQKQKQIFD